MLVNHDRLMVGSFYAEGKSSSHIHLDSVLQEALEMSARTLLLDEDTCATNFMIRDARMQVWHGMFYNIPHAILNKPIGAAVFLTKNWVAQNNV